MANGQDKDIRTGVPLPPMPNQQFPVSPDAPKDAPYLTRDTPRADAPKTTDTGLDPDFPLLSKSKGFKEAMSKIEAEETAKGTKEPSTLPRSVIMQRNLRLMEDSDFYKSADGATRVRFQTAFYNKYVVPMMRLNPTMGAEAPAGQMFGKHPITLQDWLKGRAQVWISKNPNPNISQKDMNVGGIDEQLYRDFNPLNPLSAPPVRKASMMLGAGATEAGQLIADIPNIPRDIYQKFINVKEQIGTGAALMNAELSPHMGPIVLTSEHRELQRQHYNPYVPGLGMKLDEMHRAYEYAGENWYANDWYDQFVYRSIIKTLGKTPEFMIAGAPFEALGVSAGLGEGIRIGEGAAGVDSVAYPLERTIAQRFGAWTSLVGQRAILAGAEGYLVGTWEGGNPFKEAAQWAGMSLLISPFAGMLGVSLKAAMEKTGGKAFLERMGLWTGGNPTKMNDLMTRVSDSFQKKEPHTQVTPAAVSMAGSPRQKIGRAVTNAINEVTGGKFWTMPLAAQKMALEVVAKRFPEVAEEAGLIDKHLTQLQAMKETAEWRASMPQADALLKDLEAIDGVPLATTIGDNVEQLEQKKALEKSPPGTVAKAAIDTFGETPKEPPERPDEGGLIKGPPDPRFKPIIPGEGATPPPETGSSVGGASAKSLEFSDNFSKNVDKKLDKLGLGKDKFAWESRGHKLLFYLNVLASEYKEKGPSTARDKESQFLMHQLKQEFPNKSLAELLAMSDAIWSKAKNLVLSRTPGETGPITIWRQTHLGPGESPFAHEVELLQKADKARQELETEMAGQRGVGKDIKAEAGEAELKHLKEQLANATGDERIALVRKISEAEARIAGEKAPTEVKDVSRTGRKGAQEEEAKAKPSGKPSKEAKEITPPETQSAMEAYIKALNKLGYSNADIAKMTVQDLTRIISGKIAKTAEAEKPKVEAKPKIEAKPKPTAGVETSTSPRDIDSVIAQKVTDNLFKGQFYQKLDPADKKEVDDMVRELMKKKEKGTEKGPGAANVTDPAFEETPRRGGYATYINNLTMLTGRKIRDYHDAVKRTNLTMDTRLAVKQLLHRYESDPDFRLFADAARQYVHNNGPIVDISRQVIGLDPIHERIIKGSKYVTDPEIGEGDYVIAGPTILVDQKMSLAMKPGVDKSSLPKNWDIGTGAYMRVPVSRIIPQIEALHDALRGVMPRELGLYRGMGFETFPGIPESHLAREYASQHYGMTEAEAMGKHPATRGRRLFNKFYHAEVGDEVVLSLSSFTTDFDTATGFAGTDPIMHQNVILTLEGEHKSVNMEPFNYFSESEHLVGGIFEISGKEFKRFPEEDQVPQTLHLRLKQKGTF